MEAEILKITIKMGDIQVDLTPEKLLELRDALNKLYPPTFSYTVYVPVMDRRWDGPYWASTVTSTDHITYSCE